MKRQIGTLALAAAMLLGLGAREAGATLVAGWDFSQYAADGSFTIDSTFVSVDTLNANFSDLDDGSAPNDVLGNPGRGAGSEVFGTLFYDGSFGSSAVDPDDFVNRELAPTSLNLESNENAGLIGFNSISNGDGQEFVQALRLRAFSPVSITFQADLTSVVEQGTDWSISFAGINLGGGISPMTVDFSTDGVNFTQVGQVEITDVDTLFEVALGSEVSDLAFVRLNFLESPSFGTDIDNVAINATTVVPEPGTVLMMLSGLVGLAIVGRRRRA